ncbi:hypothetical protein [Sanguibacter sp. HDW7]|uniref:hypothetical protein n=1 Tax=Sanguibacter sp. HDW7 TaxID=2714931 RepID=UPI00140DF01E|nr:hypothetical protein [Sanguibacter sp. HDW7]QIK84245.1 hypothetical protein G7063_11930 [Sanguibacter sp. HDW7]
MENLAGAAVLAIAAFWAVYLLPQRVSERSQVVEARTEDRHSGAMRILAVARREGREEPGASRDCPPGQVPHGRLLTGPMPVVVAQPVVAAEGVVTMDRPVIASQRRPGAPAGRANAPAAPSTGTTPSGSARTAAPARTEGVERTSGAERARARALAERRAAAARRRLALTLTLLAASAIAWTAVSAFSLHVAVPTALTVALGGVLALGRRAVVAARRSDAQAAARASRPAAARTSRPAARPASSTAPRRGEAARTASVTGRAVHASQTATQMISSVEVLERATAAAERSSATRERADAVRAADAAVAAVDEASATPVDLISTTTVVEAPVVAETITRTVVERPAAEADGDRVLGGFSLPRPTYTMKAAAPRREVAPLADADVTTPANAAERAGAAGTSGVTAGSAEEPGTTTEGLGLGLDAILARRRASGA